MESPERILIVGTGNLAKQLVGKLTDDFSVFVAGRTPEKTADFATQYRVAVFNATQFAAARVPVILCVPDSEIQAAAKMHSSYSSTLIHTSGTTDLETLIQFNPSAGVLWLVQTFSGNNTPDWNSIPVCIEHTDEQSRNFLSRVSHVLNGPVSELPSFQRRKLHLAAVVINNFTNHLASLADSYCKANALDFNLLLPLFVETAEKLTTHSPAQAQTGPARRGDHGTIAAHLALLNANPELRAVYSLMSEQIEQQYL